MGKYELIFFDADGTLFDFNMAEAVALKKVFEHHGFEYCEAIRRRYCEINNHMWMELEKGKIDKEYLLTNRFKNLLNEYNLDADGVLFNSIYLSFLAEGCYLTAGAAEVCKELSRQNTLAIATNGVARVQKNRLKNSALEPYIKYIVVSEDAGYQKPHRGFFQYAFNTCGQIDKKKAIIVGDSLSADIKGGMDFGIDTCWYNPEGASNESGLRVNYEIKDLRELPGLIL